MMGKKRLAEGKRKAWKNVVREIVEGWWGRKRRRRKRGRGNVRRRKERRGGRPRFLCIFFHDCNFTPAKRRKKMNVITSILNNNIGQACSRLETALETCS